jgi:hypothetical protein
LSSRSDKWTQRRIAAHVEICLGRLALNGGDKDGGDLLTANEIMQSLEGRIQERDVDSDSAEGFVSRSTASGGEDKDGSDLTLTHDSEGHRESRHGHGNGRDRDS